MGKKSLPKAIRTTAVDAREASAGLGASEQRERLAVAATSSERLDTRPAAAKPVHASDIIDEPPGAAVQASPVSPTALVHMAPGAGIDATRRRSQANSIVERHTAYAAVGGIIPVPIANVASITAVIVRMVKLLSDLYGIPFERDRARAIVVGLMGGAMPTGLGAVTTSTLFYIVPGSGLVGLAVSSIAAVACTRSIGRIFVEHFETGSSLHDLGAPAKT